MKTISEMVGRQAAARPDAVALVFRGEETSYGELERRACRVANALGGEGVGRGARVAILATNRASFFEILFGAVKIGAVVVPVNCRLAPPEVAFVVADAMAEVLFVDAAHAELVAGIAGGLRSVKRIVHLDGGAGEWPDYAAWRDGAAAEDPGLAVEGSDVAVQMYTSGTTGRPKGAQLTHDNIIAAIELAGEQIGGWTSADVNLVCMPLFHIAGCEWGIVGLYHGARNIILPEVDPVEILRLIAAQRITKVLFVPAVILFLLQTPSCAETDFSSLELVVYGASPIPLDLQQKAMAIMKCDFMQVYGLTEVTGAITLLPPEDHGADKVERMKSCGRAMAGVELKILDETGAEVGPGVVGEIVCRTAQNMLGYWNLPDETAKALRDGWFYSGDAGYMDADAYLYIYDRIKDMIISGGENIYPAEIESVLFAHPAVADVGVIGVPDDKFGEAVKAVVVCKPDTTASEHEIREFARTRLAGYKVPKSVDFVADMPRNPSGKILKRELRQPYWQGQERQVH